MEQEELAYLEYTPSSASLWLGASFSNIVTELIRLNLDGYAAISTFIMVLITAGYLLGGDNENNPDATVRHGIAMTGGLAIGTMVSEIASHLTDNPTLRLLPPFAFACLNLITAEISNNKHNN